MATLDTPEGTEPGDAYPVDPSPRSTRTMFPPSTPPPVTDRDAATNNGVLGLAAIR
jgi:hypothetical protein